MQKIRVQKPISETEFTKYLNDKDNVLKFTRELGKTAKAAAAVMKYEGVITKSITLIKDIYSLYWKKDKSDYNESISKLAKNRNELKKGYEKMKIVMDCINVLGECAPTGMSEMIELYVKAFKAAGKTVKFASDYAEKIEKAVKKDMGALQKVVENNTATAIKSLQFDDKNKRAHKKYTNDQYLDLVLGRPK